MLDFDHVTEEGGAVADASDKVFDALLAYFEHLEGEINLVAIRRDVAQEKIRDEAIDAADAEFAARKRCHRGEI